MKTISSKTLQDLEFQTVLEQVSELTITELGANEISKLKPYLNEEELKIALNQTNEYLSSFENENIIPNHFFESITDELNFLKIEDYFLEISSFRKIKTIAESSNDLISFFKKFKEYYPVLFETSDQILNTKAISEAINKVINRFGEIKDDASEQLGIIRRQLKGIQGKINQSFVSALSHHNNLGYLDDIKETVIDNRRVLAVTAMHRRKVKGSLLGSSKTGSIVYIEPQATLQLTRELQDLTYQERDEIIKVLKNLTKTIRDYRELLTEYQLFLTKIDCIAAKAKYAQKLNAILPEISSHKELFLRDAYHPLLYLNNTEKGEKTYPQTIDLNSDNRIIVISGPNAGGKSITLKTIGLLQVMLQSGFLVPLHERSKMCLFDRVLTDIGDNQSIENHLSTYSYRLKNMNHFLKKCSDSTLFLIDEFGTGSDPELGGALAEAFLEVFYEREAYGIITTHYANLKILADELPAMTNANMTFDNRTLLPTFQLALGQPGSSFTFEVAQKNGIPYSLINKAKKKVERGKVRFDKTIARLQKERSKLEKTTKNLSTEEEKKRLEAEKLEKVNQRIQNKLESYQELYDANRKLLTLGERVDKMAESYFNNKQKKRLIGDFLKLVEVENSKRKKLTKKEKIVKKKKEAVVKKEVEKKVTAIREQKKEEKKKEALQPPKPKHILKIGDRVRLMDSKAVGTLDKIEKKKAFVNYGFFTSECSLEQLELVQRMK
ncbi:endonuclease MutS2 [Pseudofulvibacter geojedonensis]|uniref:DNA mismatch repair protein MutS n=1 Tax=Pseudofulvibacter geojedonensis TaxID=1123758 RepID=A0ABW3HXY4_9FLAO